MKTSEVQNLKIKGCISLDNLCVMDIKGEDAKVKEFLQGQITSDIQKVGLNTLHLSSICNQKGQIVADFIILRLVDGFKVVIHLRVNWLHMQNFLKYSLRFQNKM